MFFCVKVAEFFFTYGFVILLAPAILTKVGNGCHFIDFLPGARPLKANYLKHMQMTFQVLDDSLGI